MTRIWVPGYDEVLDVFERYKRQDKNVERAKDRVMSACWKQTSYIKRDPIKAYQEVPALQRYIELREQNSEELCRQIDLLKPLRDKVFSMLELIEHPEKTMLYMFYILNHEWVKVSLETSYSLSQCKEIRNIAIAKIASIIFSRTQSDEKSIL